MTERKLLVLALAAFITVGAVSGGITVAVLSDSEAVTAELSPDIPDTFGNNDGSTEDAFGNNGPPADTGETFGNNGPPADAKDTGAAGASNTDTETNTTQT